MHESAVISFYKGHGTDHAGRRFAEILSWDHRRLEMVHDYIQWLFPLPEPSRFNPEAPLLTSADVAVFRASPELQAKVLDAFDLMLNFLGLERTSGAIARGPSFESVSGNWLTPANHNHLRLTRIMLFLRHAGHGVQAERLLACLEDIAAHEGKDAISARTLSFWRAAIKS
ncbi:MAG: hypothetical protein JNK21_01960 [Rhodospirillaceae bacterium]|nr:hypothetical protein [Rhodospirillaceae bacterium]